MEGSVRKRPHFHYVIAVMTKKALINPSFSSLSRHWWRYERLHTNPSRSPGFAHRKAWRQ